MKKLLYLIVFCFMFIGISSVSASTYYTNSKGVDFTEEEYNYISELYFDGYQSTMTQADLDKMKEFDLIGKPISKRTLNESKLLGTRSTSVTGGGRTLTISSSCGSTYCLVSLNAVWSGTPSVQSWDVIGFRYSGLTGIIYGSASVVGTGYSASYVSSGDSFQSFSNGFGYSVKLGNSNNLSVSTSFYCDSSNAGKLVYGSYQHAMVSVSKATSKQYTIGVGGYGYVFHFSGNAYGKYDGAPGVFKNI